MVPDIEVLRADEEEFEREIDLAHALPSRRRDPRQSLASVDAKSCERDITMDRFGGAAEREKAKAETEDGKETDAEAFRDSVLECAVGYFEGGSLANYRNQLEPLLRAGL